MIIDVSSWGDFDALHSNGLLISETEVDLNIINKEFIKHLEKNEIIKEFTITEEKDNSLKIMVENPLTKDIKEHVIYFKDNNICSGIQSLFFDYEDYENYLFSIGFKRLNAKNIIINSDM